MSDAPVPDALRPHLAMSLVPGLGPRLTVALLEHFGSASAALRATAAQLESVPMIGATLAARFARSFSQVNVDVEWALAQKHGVTIALPGQPGYPDVLTTIPDAPPLLYSRGSFLPIDSNAVGIVGSRACTPYGKRVAAQIAAGLVRAGYTVISGLARGIDGAAHQAALDAGGRTLAVLAGGLSEIYPREHTELAEACVRGGAIMTETPMTVDPQPGMFPARNRIISGLSRGIVVIEANARSGALITATHAADQGREVFVVPANVDSMASAGCLELIRKGAKMVRNADDILEDLCGISMPLPPPLKANRRTTPTNLFNKPQPPPAVPVEQAMPHGLDEQQQRIWDALATARQADELSRELAMASGDLTVQLMKLEMKRIIRRMPGNVYERRT